MLSKLARLQGGKDIWVRGFYPTLTMPFDRTTGKNIIMLLHDDFSGFPWSRRMLFGLLNILFHRSLLKASTVVVTISQFLDGWCRTAHEAMLCGRPVIGSGSGGMRELLEGGGQVICPRFDALRAQVDALLRHPAKADEIGDRGRKFAAQFTDERSASAWRDVVKELVPER